MKMLKCKIAVLWTALMCGYALHNLTDLMPVFWNVKVAVDTSGCVPVGLLMFMMCISFTIPVVGILCTFCGKRPCRIVNVVLAALVTAFNVFHLSEFFADFNAVQLFILPFILLISVVLFILSCRFVKCKCNHCDCGDDCKCGDNCQCGDDCACGCNDTCDCGTDCKCNNDNDCGCKSDTGCDCGK